MFRLLKPRLTSPTLPTPEYMENLREALKYSPDMTELQRHTGQFLFVYDQMQRNAPRHSLLSGGSIFFGTFYTHDQYSVWDRSSDHRVIALEDNTRPGKIRGELFGVRPTRFLTLDKEMENGYTFTRKRVRIDALCFEPREVIVPVQSWMYVGNPDYWDTRLDNGYRYECLKPKPYNKRPTIGAYHHFETNE